MKKIAIALSVSATVLLAFLVGIYLERNGDIKEHTNKTISLKKAPFIKYGINLSDFVVMDSRVEKNEVFADILLKNNVAYQSVRYILSESKEIFNYNKIRAGNKYTVLGEKTDTGFVPKKIIYEENKIDYVVFNVDDSLYIHRGQNKIERKHREVAGVIRSSLYETFDGLDLNPALAVRLADIFACTVDFYKIHEGDKFKIVFDEDYADGKPVSVGEISSALFNSNGKDYYAFYYEKDKMHEGEYFDEQGNSMKKQFLKSPVKFARISSRFNLNRFHPVAKVFRAHLGTDYAASYGTPILATADGIVEEAKFGVYNGNYVKIRHSGQFKTQYLHMCRIGKGICSGRKVRQGETIGYVGSTGLATGPHVCYRFWKDGQQVDPFHQSLKFSEPMSNKYKADFLTKTKNMKESIDDLAYDADPLKKKEEKVHAAITNSTSKFITRFF